MPSFITDILRWPVFPLFALVLIAILYWRGFLSMRQADKKRADADAPGTSKPSDKPETL